MERVPEPEIMDVPERAQAYADADFAEVNEAFVARLGELIRSEGQLRALDLGTGPGDIPLMVAREQPKWQIAAVDASWPMLRIGEATRRERFPEAGVRFSRCDVKGLPLADGTFDVIFSNSLLHHLGDPMPLWEEMRRVGGEGARFFVRDLLRPESSEAARTIVETYAADEHPLLKEDFYNSLLAAFSVEEVVEQLADAGLTESVVYRVTDRHLDVAGTIQ